MTITDQILTHIKEEIKKTHPSIPCNIRNNILAIESKKYHIYTRIERIQLITTIKVSTSYGTSGPLCRVTHDLNNKNSINNTITLIQNWLQ